MTGSPEPLDELVSHARETRVLVIGGGIAGLVAAWECAKVGMPVTVVEASGSFGGTIADAEVGGLRVDTGATCWSAGGPARALVDELGLSDRVVTPRTDRTWITGLGRGGAAPVPEQTVLGIPANAWDDGVRRFIGWRGAWRAYVDRLRPPLTIGKERNLARLVRTRMGDAVLDRLVAPLSLGRFGLAPDLVDVAAAAPGLSPALTRTGSLGGAVAELLVDRDGTAAIESLDGGMTQLVDALVTRLRGLGAVLETGRRVQGIEPVDEGWSAVFDDGADQPAFADIVVVAVGPSEAAALLVPHMGEAVTRMTDASTTREIVTLVVDQPDLDAAPRGAQCYPVPGTARASGLVHETARWEWLSREAGPGRHVLHVAFDGEAAATGAAEADASAIAREEASALLGVPLGPDVVRGVHRAVFPLPLPASALGHEDHATAVRDAVSGREGLAVVGAWLAGSGLARVVADARDEAERVRRAALWGSSTVS